MKRFSLLKLMLALVLSVLGSTGAFAQLIGSTQYGTDGFKYKILSLNAGNTVSVSQNVYANAGAEAMVIPATVTINVKGNDTNGDPVDGIYVFDVVEIEDDGFNGVTKATSIQIGKNVQTIGASAFEGCSNVTNITFADGNANDITINNDAFKGTKVTALDLTNTQISEINQWFDSSYSLGTPSNETLQSVKFPATLKTVKSKAFAGCTRLQTLTFTAPTHSLNQTIGAGAFSETAIQTLDLTNVSNLKTLNQLFENDNVTLNKVIMPASIVTLEENALANCIQLSEVDFSKATKLTTLKNGSLSNTIVSSYDFSNCSYNNANSLGLDAYTPFVNATTKTNKNLTKVVLPKKTTTSGVTFCTVAGIGTAFANCEKLTTIENFEISNVTTIENGAFASDKSLTELTFPKTLTNVNGSPFMKDASSNGCEKLAKLTFQSDVTIGDGINGIFGVQGDDYVVCPLETLIIKVNAGQSRNATIAIQALETDGAYSNLQNVEIAKSGKFAGDINAFAMAEGKDAVVEFGDITTKFTGQITGPKGVKATTLTIGEYSPATDFSVAIVTNRINKATVGGEVKKAKVLTAIGLAKEIEFKGDITSVGLTAFTNTELTTLDFNNIKMKIDAIPSQVFISTKTANLTDVTWKPEDGDALKAFNFKAFGNSPAGAAAKVTLHTTTAVADGCYGMDENNLYNVIFDAKAAPIVPETTDVPVYGNSTSVYYYGKFKAGDSNAYFEKGDGDVVVYSAFVDAADQKIYMDPLALNNGRYIVAANQVVIVRVKNPAETENMVSPVGGKSSVVVANETTDDPTMRYDNMSTIVNDLEMTDKVFSSDYIGTNYVGQTLYAMGNPAKEGSLVWGKVGPTQYLPKNAVFVQTEELEAPILSMVWLDGNADATAIEEIINKRNANNDAIYDLNGVRVNNPAKGVYIQNGKKFVVK